MEKGDAEPKFDTRNRLNASSTRVFFIISSISDDISKDHSSFGAFHFKKWSKNLVQIQLAFKCNFPKLNFSYLFG